MSYDQLTLGAAGNRTGVTELSGRKVAYGYDNLYRLTSETIANAAMSGTVGYTYDAVGNRKQITSTLAAIPASGLLNYDANDRTATDTYDNNGNIVSQAGIEDTYDFENHLMQNGLNVGVLADVAKKKKAELLNRFVNGKDSPVRGMAEIACTPRVAMTPVSQTNSTMPGGRTWVTPRVTSVGEAKLEWEVPTIPLALSKLIPTSCRIDAAAQLSSRTG